MDATYRSDLREVNELNFARFDAKFEQRLAEFDARFERRLAELRGELIAEIARAQTATIRWMFTFWAPTALAIAGTAVGVIALLIRR